MYHKKLDWIISIIREQMVANAPGTQGGFSDSADSKGPVAGFDPVMGTTRRKGPQIKLPPGSRKRWMKKKPPQ
jgi:hypothetical protein